MPFAFTFLSEKAMKTKSEAAMGEAVSKIYFMQRNGSAFSKFSLVTLGKFS